MRCILNLMFFLWNNFLSFFWSVMFIRVVWYIWSNVVKLMFIAYFSLMSLTMMVFSACVNDAVHHIYVLLKAVCDRLWLIMWLSLHHLHLMVISVFKMYKTDFSTSIGWCVNIISVNEITVFNCKFKLKPQNLKCYRIFYGRISATTATVFLTVNLTVNRKYTVFFYSVKKVVCLYCW